MRDLRLPACITERRPPVPDRDAVTTSVRSQFTDAQVTRSRKLEGQWWGDGGAYFVCSFARSGAGGDGSVNTHDGQVWFFDPSDSTITLKTIFGKNPDPAVEGGFDGPDNITVSPYGGVILAEDGEGLSHLVGVTEAGTAYALARNESTRASSPARRSPPTARCSSPTSRTRASSSRSAVPGSASERASRPDPPRAGAGRIRRPRTADLRVVEQPRPGVRGVPVRRRAISPSAVGPCLAVRDERHGTRWVTSAPGGPPRSRRVAPACRPGPHARAGVSGARGPRVR